MHNVTRAAGEVIGNYVANNILQSPATVDLTDSTVSTAISTRVSYQAYLNNTFLSAQTTDVE